MKRRVETTRANQRIASANRVGESESSWTFATGWTEEERCGMRDAANAWRNFRG